MVIVSVTTVVMAVSGCLDYLRTSRRLQVELAANLETTALQLASSLALPLWNFQDEQAAKIVESAMLHEEVALVLVREALNPRLVVAKSRRADWSVVDSDVPVPGDEMVSTRTDILFNDRHIGSVEVFLTTRFIRQTLNIALVTYSLSVLLVDVLLVGLLFLILDRSVVKPLRAVATYARAVGEGDLRHGAIPGRSFLREFVDLRGSIEGMVRELNARNVFIQDILDAMPSLVICVGADTRITHANRAAGLLAGQPPEALKKRLLPEAFPAMEPFLEDILEALRSGDEVFRNGLPMALESGKRLVDLLVLPSSGEVLRGAVIRLDDVTDRKRMEALILQTEKMLSLGGLAAGMAHEINNPLSGILHGVQNINRRFSPDIEANATAAREAGCDIAAVSRYVSERGILEFLDSIRQSGERAAKIVRNMLGFTRPGTFEKAPTSLTELAERSLELAATDFDLKKKYDFKRIHIVREYRSDVPQVRCAAMEIEQVLLNLLRNAAQALASRQDAGFEPQIVVRVRADERRAYLEVEDNGPGMEENVRCRIFEPFFTTKEPGEGTGLGLSVSYFIVTHNHGGTILAESEPGRGAKFVVSLPLDLADG